jgi:hypothetical protein
VLAATGLRDFNTGIFCFMCGDTSEHKSTCGPISDGQAGFSPASFTCLNYSAAVWHFNAFLKCPTIGRACPANFIASYNVPSTPLCSAGGGFSCGSKSLLVMQNQSRRAHDDQVIEEIRERCCSHA